MQFQIKQDGEDKFHTVVCKEDQYFDVGDSMLMDVISMSRNSIKSFGHVLMHPKDWWRMNRKKLRMTSYTRHKNRKYKFIQ